MPTNQRAFKAFLWSNIVPHNELFDSVNFKTVRLNSDKSQQIQPVFQYIQIKPKILEEPESS
jgi:hypothetical protein